MNSDIVEVATIGRCVGLRGYLKLHNKSDFPEQFKKGATFFDKNDDQLIIKDYNRKKELVLFENFDGGIRNVYDGYGFCSNASGGMDSA